MRTLLATLVLFMGARAAAADHDALSLAVNSYLDGSVPMLALQPDAEPWNGRVSFYIWVSSIEGTIGARGQTAPFDASFDDILDELEFAFTLRASVREGEWTYAADLFYLEVGSTVFPVGLPRVDTSTSWTIFEFTAGRDVAKTTLGNGGELTAQAYGGFRLHTIRNRISIGGTPQASEARWIFDPIIGGELRGALGALTILLRIDFGGFGIGSDFTWNVITGAEIALSSEFAIVIGYRWFDMDGKTGGLSFDFLAQGPFFAITFRF